MNVGDQNEKMMQTILLQALTDETAKSISAWILDLADGLRHRLPYALVMLGVAPEQYGFKVPPPKGEDKKSPFSAAARAVSPNLSVELSGTLYSLMIMNRFFYRHRKLARTRLHACYQQTIKRNW